MRKGFDRIRNWISYKKVFTGTAERNGVVYKKYSKIRRFRSSHRRLFLTILAVLLGLLLLQKMLPVLLKPMTPEDFPEPKDFSYHE